MPLQLILQMVKLQKGVLKSVNLSGASIHDENDFQELITKLDRDGVTGMETLEFAGICCGSGQFIKTFRGLMEKYGGTVIHLNLDNNNLSDVEAAIPIIEQHCGELESLYLGGLHGYLSSQVRSLQDRGVQVQIAQDTNSEHSPLILECTVHQVTPLRGHGDQGEERRGSRRHHLI
jgi:hypothetical protein